MKSDIVVGLFLGDEGKGTTVDYLCSQQETNAVVRFSGGAQAAHNVVTPDGQHHTFAQLGSGSFHGVRTIHTKYMMINPFSMVREADKFYNLTGYDALADAVISANSLLTTPLHAAINKKREILRGASAHGSTGQGIGETQNYFLHAGSGAPVMGDLIDLSVLFAKLEKLAEWAEAEVGNIWGLIPSLAEIKLSYKNLADDALLRIVPDAVIYSELSKGYNVFEGSQGVLLDENYGFHPHTTWATTTPFNAQTVLAAAGLEAGRVIGVTRTYGTRHGAGPFPSEFSHENWIEEFPEHHNKRGKWQGAWRGGYLDLPLLKYASQSVGTIDVVAVTHLDVMSHEIVVGYEGWEGIPEDFVPGDLDKQQLLGQTFHELRNAKQIIEVVDEDELVAMIEENVGAPVGIKSYGPAWTDKIEVG